MSNTSILRVGGSGNCVESLRKLGEFITMAHPDLHVFLDPSKKLINVALIVESLRIEIRVTVFARRASNDIVLAEAMSDFLKAVADSKHWNSEVKECGINVGGTVFVYTVGTTGEDDALGFEWEIGKFLSAWEHFTVYIQIAESSSDQVSLDYTLVL